ESATGKQVDHAQQVLSEFRVLGESNRVNARNRNVHTNAVNGNHAQRKNDSLLETGCRQQLEHVFRRTDFSAALRNALCHVLSSVWGPGLNPARAPDTDALPFLSGLATGLKPAPRYCNQAMSPCDYHFYR